MTRGDHRSPAAVDGAARNRRDRARRQSTIPAPSLRRQRPAGDDETTSTTTIDDAPRRRPRRPRRPRRRRKQASLQDYLTALADGRYDDAAVLLNEGGLEPERRADLRPLFTEYGDVDDLAARLQSWCENEAICTAPDAPPVDIGGYWVATWTTPDGRADRLLPLRLVRGLAERRTGSRRADRNGSVVACPTSDVDLVREADLDGDGHAGDDRGDPRSAVRELLVRRVQHEPRRCRRSSCRRRTTSSVGVLQPASDPAATRC